MKTLRNYFILFSAGLLPKTGYGQTVNSHNAKTLIESIGSIVSTRLIPLMILLALVYIAYAVFEYIAEGAESQAKEEKKQKIFWGVIGLFIIVSIWALVAIVANSFGIFAGGTLKAQ
jgi:hypothetical protein